MACGTLHEQHLLAGFSAVCAVLILNRPTSLSLFVSSSIVRHGNSGISTSAVDHTFIQAPKNLLIKLCCRLEMSHRWTTLYSLSRCAPGRVDPFVLSQQSLVCSDGLCCSSGEAFPPSSGPGLPLAVVCSYFALVIGLTVTQAGESYSVKVHIVT